MTRHILLTGGAGYIGSHTYVELLAAGHQVTILDDFSNADRSVITRLAKLTGQMPQLLEQDIRDQAALARAFETHGFDAAIHFAAKKAVGESVAKPLDYVSCNVGGLVTLMQVMQAQGVFDLVFSSSATVYGDPEVLPIPETAPLSHTNPYGMTKLMGEEILRAAQIAEPRWRIGILRYFNPVGAHDSGLIGEDPNGIPNNLMPYIAKVAAGELPHVQVFGDDYDTPDGTGVRDYIHVCDLARGHVQSLEALAREDAGHLVNLGTGRGISVLEMIAAYSVACGTVLPHKIAPRRAGDVASCYADPAKARAALGFDATRDLTDMCRSSWAWISGQARG
ncbi:UDP-glucose 4-epimerase GalE [Cognatishimia sp. SS12]|uniref:UDP-glucose 4-epimerase GalE n=1 Tax=Cognatishimia sp. SS12 TaxID=2979465 RepID=UPI00232E507F|nr:UDP-glucose 4-epimerase GalE [Cognatishimia sp. SS12]MDC0738714.1 UDP-glucose 4-epimerase GalE [Cognatishimia sp. SS12]